MPVAPAMRTGRPWPMGASVDAEGLNIAVFSAHASAIELCLYDAEGRVETQRFNLPARTGDVWHGHLDAVGAGQVYGLRAQGPWAPQQGHRFNANKLLLDPYAREIVGDFAWHDMHRGDDASDAQRQDGRDNGATALKARVVDDRFDWQGDTAPGTPWAETVLYELHVRAFTRLHPGLAESQRGTYAGLASDAAVAHLRRLGVTAVCLLPVHRFIDEERLVRMGLRNHWGYNTLSFFCPEPRYASATGGRAVRDEFREMVSRLHAAGIEVILDVVFNHTAETDAFGPTLSWRGLDNASYYRLVEGRQQDYENHTGCGNTLDMRRPQVLQMVMDSLRYWVQEMHVDGFRFDLATVLGRGSHGFERDGPFFACLAQDPQLTGIKLIAEPWDIGPGGYQLGHFPSPWREWNDRFRDTMRAFWLRGERNCGDFARRLCASSDLFQQRGRVPSAAVNYVVSHDGFTLRDLLSYEQRHNEANGEGNRDGHGHNLSWNCGTEGSSDDASVLALRARLQRALLSCLLLSQGTPMLVAGDELGHTQHGNNNPYCQDNALTWIDWAHADDTLITFTSRLLQFRRQWLPLGDAWFEDGAFAPGEAGLVWLCPDGRPPQAAQWNDPKQRTLGLWLRRLQGATKSLLMLFNAGADEMPFALPAGHWQVLVDSSTSDAKPAQTDLLEASTTLPARAICVLASSGD